MGTRPVAYAFTLGLLAAVNPCGFPLLPAYLSQFAYDSSDRGWGRRTARALMAGLSVTAGFVVTFGLAGLLVESGMILILS
jgi:cytochrome c biogenesis protein CcdA